MKIDLLSNLDTNIGLTTIQIYLFALGLSIIGAFDYYLVIKAGKFKKINDMPNALKYTEKAYMYFKLIWLSIYIFLFTVKLTVNQYIVLIIFFFITILYFLPKIKKSMMDELYGRSPKNTVYDKKKYTDEHFLIILFDKVKTWSICMLTLYIIMWIFALLDPDIVTSKITSNLFESAKGFLLIFIIGLPFCLIPAIWDYIKMKRKQRYPNSA